MGIKRKPIKSFGQGQIVGDRRGSKTLVNTPFWRKQAGPEKDPALVLALDPPCGPKPASREAGRALHELLGLPLSIEAAARLIGCSPWTVRQRHIPNGLPVFRSAASGKLTFYTNQVVRWILEQQQRRFSK